MRSDRLRWTAALLLAVVAVLGAGCSSSGDAEPPPAPPGNLAFLDVEASRTVLDEMTPAVEGFYSYDFRQLDEHEMHIMAVTTARFWSEIEPTLPVVREVAPRKQITVTAEVIATSLRVLEPGRAELLLFVNRSTTQAGDPPQPDATSVVVTAERIGSTWKIDGLELV
jgi:Mce-associated membrane protein